MSKNAQVRSKLLEIARILWLVSARTQICVLTVCQQQRWQVLEHCANSRVRASVGTDCVPTAELSVPTLEQRPCVFSRVSTHNAVIPGAGLEHTPSTRYAVDCRLSVSATDPVPRTRALYQRAGIPHAAGPRGTWRAGGRGEMEPVGRSLPLAIVNCCAVTYDDDRTAHTTYARRAPTTVPATSILVSRLL